MRTYAVIAGLVAVLLTGATVSAAEPVRLVHAFNFDERDEGNVEELPKFWEPLRPPGFPHYAGGRFDEEVGHDAPPSFYLVSEGRNVAFQYVGPDTRVRSSTDYRIVGYIRPDRLFHARACLSAHFVNASGQALARTLVRSRFVGSHGDQVGWVKVELFLPPAPPEAVTIGLVGWVLQESVWIGPDLRPHQIQRNDVRGGAWFDDISIFALPAVELRAGAKTNVFPPDRPNELFARITDHDNPKTYGRLVVLDHRGETIESRVVTAGSGAGAEPMRMSVAHLAPGRYVARLDALANDAVVRSRSLTFLRLAPRRRDPHESARSFGVVIDPGNRPDPLIELALLDQQAVHSVKLPIWSGLPDEPNDKDAQASRDRLVQEAVKRGFRLTGVLAGPPGPIARHDGAFVRPLLELLTEDESVWGRYLSTAVAPNATAIRWWELMVSDGGIGTRSERLIDAVTALRNAMRPYVTLPRLSLRIAPNGEPPSPRAPVDRITLAFPGFARPDDDRARIAEAKSLTYPYVSAFVEPLPARDYQRLPRLANWARRILSARHAGADPAFVPQTWHVSKTPGGRIIEPLEEFILLRTMADVIGDAVPGPTILTEPGIVGLAFYDGSQSVIALWDPTAPPDGRNVPIQMGQADQQVDLWGESTALRRDATGRQVVRVGRMPVLVPNVDRWLVELRTAVAIRPSTVVSGSEEVEHEVELNYKGDRALSGRFEFATPEGWHVMPRSFTINLAPSGTDQQSVAIQYPHNQTAGTSTLRAKIHLVDESVYLEVPLTITINVPDLDVSGFAVVEHDTLLIRQVVTNRSGEALSLRAAAAVPGRERQYRPIAALKPGETQAVHYRFADGNQLIGKPVRLSLREVNDGPRSHSLEILIP